MKTRVVVVSFIAVGMVAMAPVGSSKAMSRLEAARVETKAKVDAKARGRVFGQMRGVPILRLGGTEFAVLDPPSSVAIGARAKRVSLRRWPRIFNRFRGFIQAKKRGEKPPDSVNRRAKQTSVKYQGRYRATSVAFALTAAVEAAYGGGKLDLSEEHAWRLMTDSEPLGPCASGSNLVAAANRLKMRSLSLETDWSYDTRIPKDACAETPKKRRARDKRLSKKSRHRVTHFYLLGRVAPGKNRPAVNHPPTIEAAVASGHEIVLGLGIAGTAWRGGAKRRVDVELDEQGQVLQPVGYQAVVLVGYDRKTETFIAKSSWGIHKGDRGYLSLAYDYIRAYAEVGVFIDKVQRLRR